MQNHSANKILLVEDDTNFGDVLRSYLEIHDYEVTLATDGEAGLKAFNDGNYNLCIFDVMMPRKDGFSLLKDVRTVDTTTPIIFLTAKAMNEDVIKGFKEGADDYITKPFNSEELLYRIQAILKRTQGTKELKDDIKEFSFGRYHFNYPLRILTFDAEQPSEKTFKLSPKESQLLRLFAINRNEVLQRSEALTNIWGEDTYFTARSMDVFVTKLRKYLNLDSNIEIVNIHGNGFQLLIREQEEM